MYRETRPHVGFSPVIPFAEEGKRIDPPVSEPLRDDYKQDFKITGTESISYTAPNAKRPEMTTPEPLEDTPGQYSAFQGLQGTFSML
jgi:hypothetical protein